MSQTPVSIGTTPNDGTGDTLRAAFLKLNSNDADLDARVQALAVLVAQTLSTPAAQKALLTAIVAALPTTKPSAPGVLWRNGGLVQIS